MVVSVVRAGAIVFRVALVGKLRDMSWACCIGSGGSLKSNDAAICESAYAVSERDGSSDEAMFAREVLEDENWVGNGDTAISLRYNICNSPSWRVSEWVLDTVFVHFLEIVEFLTGLSLCARRTISNIADRANRNGVFLSLCYGNYWHSKIDLVEGRLFGELGKLDSTSSNKVSKSSKVAGGENWLSSSRFERNLGRRVLLGGAIPACSIDFFLFFFNFVRPRVCCLVRLWLEKWGVVASILGKVLLRDSVRLNVFLTLWFILRMKRVVSIGATRWFEASRNGAVPVLGSMASLARNCRRRCWNSTVRGRRRSVTEILFGGRSSTGEES